MGNCSDLQTERIKREMRAYTRKLLPEGPLPDWAESAMKQHAEYAAQDFCKSHGLAGLGSPDILTTLPSIRAAEAYWLDEPGSTRLVIMSTLGRAALVGLGLLAVGQRRGVVKGALAGAVAIEAFVMWTTRQQLRDAGRLPGQKQAAP